ncbi:MAG: condensation domain-containing protein, partial [Bacteroidota bacterium]
QLGGHSLMAMKMLSVVQKKFAVTIPIAAFFQEPTIQFILDLIRADEQREVKAIEPLSANNGLEEYVDLSFAQKRIWMQDQLLNGSNAYNIPYAFRVKGELDLQKLNDAIHFLITRHASLRTNFLTVEGELKQRVLAPSAIQFAVAVTEMEDCEEDSVLSLIDQKNSQTFDLEKDILFRCFVFHHGPMQSTLLFIFHHIIMDELSSSIFGRELLYLLEHGMEAFERNFSKLPIQYTDFVAWEKRQLWTDKLEEKRQYFRSKLQGDLPVINIETDFPRPTEKSFAGASTSYEFSSEINQQLLALCSAQGCSLFVLLTAITKTLLFRLSNQEDIVMGTLEANRPHVDVESLIGCFFNVIPLRTIFNREDRFADLLNVVKQQFFETLDHANYPFDLLLHDLDIKTPPGRSPLFDVTVALKNLAEEDAPLQRIGNIELEQIHLPADSCKYDLVFMFEKETDRLSLTLNYSTALFSASTIDGYFEILLTIINAVVNDPMIALYEIGNQETSLASPSIDSSFNF